MITTVKFNLARSRFDAWAGIDAPDLPPHPIDAIQVRLARWQAVNFEPPSNTELACGCTEECGELVNATTDDELRDALGDICIYAAQLCTLNRLAIGPLMSGEVYRHDLGPPAGLLAAAGDLSHDALKRAQRIRRSGTAGAEEYRMMIAHRIERLCASAWDTARHASAARRLEQPPPPIAAMQIVAMTVLARDWNAERAKGGRQ